MTVNRGRAHITLGNLPQRKNRSRWNYRLYGLPLFIAYHWILLCLRFAPDWDQRKVGARAGNREAQGIRYCWFNSDGEYERAGDRPSVIRNDGARIWHRNGIRHRDNGPAYIEPFGRVYWQWNGYLANDELGLVLSGVFFDRHLTEEHANDYLAIAVEYDRIGAWMAGGRPDTTTVLEWVSKVIVHNPSPHLSDEYRTYVALRALAGV